jgi:uracil-DNA glycosylase
MSPATELLNWDHVLGAEKKKTYFIAIVDRLNRERKAGKLIFPANDQLFNAFKLTPFSTLKIVILGQDPYHGTGQAHGLSFSVQKPVKQPPSLQNIFKELQNDVGMIPPKHGDLTGWAKQGVLLLNASLSVEAGLAQSHAQYGWHQFTDHVIDCINEHPEPVVFMLWGTSARSKAFRLDRSRHLILEAPHPSPLSAHRGFLGCRHFSKANTFLQKVGRTPIRWDELP